MRRYRQGVSWTPARAWHAITAVVVLAAFVLQVVLVVQGDAILVEDDPPGLGLRLARFIAYFTIQSNLLVAVASVLLIRDPHRDGAVFRSLRLAGIVGITVTGLVHFFLLRPLLELEGASYVADKLLHMAVPVVAVIGWVAFGPRRRVDGAAIAVSFAWPIAWLAVTLSVAGGTRWVPYPFLNFRVEGWAHVGAVCVGITALFAVVIGLCHYADRHLRPAH